MSYSYSLYVGPYFECVPKAGVGTDKFAVSESISEALTAIDVLVDGNIGWVPNKKRDQPHLFHG